MSSPPALPPWPIPLALGVALGSAVATSPSLDASTPVAAMCAAATMVAVSGALLLTPSTGAARLAVAAFALLAGIGILLGGARGLVWASADDPWAASFGAPVELEGRSDGVTLWTDGGGLVLRGVPVPEGRVRVGGALEALPGRRNPGGIDLREHWRRRGARAALRVGVVLEAPRRPAPREALRRGVVTGLSAPAAGLVQAMTLGLRDELGDLRDVFAASGLAHVLALSGLHVGVLAGVMAMLARPLGRWAPAVVVGGIGAYVGVVGATPSVLRAALMVGAIALTATLRAGPPAALASLALAALVGLMIGPAAIHDLAFQLSYLSVAGIVLLAPGLLALVPQPRRGWRRTARVVFVGGAAVSIAAQTASGSLVASTFGALPLVSPLTNVLAVPLATLLVPLGFLAGVAGLLGEGAARAVNLVTSPTAEALIALARLGARATVLPWGEVAWSGHVAYGAGVAAVAAALGRRLRPSRAAAVVLSAVAVSAATPPPYPVPEIVALDVGQGDAIVIRVARGRAVLVDGGGTPWGDYDVGARVVVPALRAMGVGALSVVVATHADLDHVEGLLSVIGAMPIGEIWIGHREDDRPVFRALMQAAALHGVPVREVRRGASATIGRVTLDVVHPTAERSRVPNDDSVTVVVRVDGVAWALLAGDVSSPVEADLPVPHVSVVLAPHHGSSSSTSDALLRATRPRLALVSVGRNRFGHPAPSVLARLARHGVAVRTTHDEGALRVPFPLP